MEERESWCSARLHVKPLGRYGLGLFAAIGFELSAPCDIERFRRKTAQGII